MLLGWRTFFWRFFVSVPGSFFFFQVSFFLLSFFLSSVRHSSSEAMTAAKISLFCRCMMKKTEKSTPNYDLLRGEDEKKWYAHFTRVKVKEKMPKRSNNERAMKREEKKSHENFNSPSHFNSRVKKTRRRGIRCKTRRKCPKDFKRFLIHFPPLLTLHLKSKNFHGWNSANYEE